MAYYTGYRQRGVLPALHRGLPSPFLTLIFRALAGCPPSQWITEEFRNIQAGAWLFEGAFEGA